MHSGVYLTNFEVFGNVIKNVQSGWYIFSIETKTKEKTDKKIVILNTRYPNIVTVMISFV